MADEHFMMAIVQGLQKEMQQQEHTIEVQRETIGVLKKRLLLGIQFAKQTEALVDTMVDGVMKPMVPGECDSSRPWKRQKYVDHTSITLGDFLRRYHIDAHKGSSVDKETSELRTAPGFSCSENP